ncbi:unnamed protein product [Paramecium sonneborni]|uniref:Uncharacterized protein n=1 Tax=Paramecium sonneborni TaxID=65129 RepID=A0A8S1P6Q1_9CILI|nr:unnamed protein product [Paramecium sonneborni]
MDPQQQQQREQSLRNHFDIQQNRNNLNTNNSDKLNEKPYKYIVLTKQKQARKNQHFEQDTNRNQDSQEQFQNQKILSETQQIQSYENIIRNNSTKQVINSIPEIKILPLRGYNDDQKQQNSILSQPIQNINYKVQNDQSINITLEINNQSYMSPSKPPPLKGYKDRQNEESKVIQLTRSNDKRIYLDTEQIKYIQQNTSKRFDIDKSEKHRITQINFVQYSVLKNVSLLSSVDNYEIQAGIINLTQIKQKSAFPKVYGLNEKGECLSSQTKTPIKLLLNQSYLFAYLKEYKNLVCLDLMKNTQYAIQLPNDENCDYVFFIKMSNLEIQLI